MCSNSDKKKFLENEMVKQRKEILQTEIEDARQRLDHSLETLNDYDVSYLLSVKLDKLIAEYVELCEAEGA
jgi:DNA-directed RNA polymerase